MIIRRRCPVCMAAIGEPCRDLTGIDGRMPDRLWRAALRDAPVRDLPHVERVEVLR